MLQMWGNHLFLFRNFKMTEEIIATTKPRKLIFIPIISRKLEFSIYMYKITHFWVLFQICFYILTISMIHVSTASTRFMSIQSWQCNITCQIIGLSQELLLFCIWTNMISLSFWSISCSIFLVHSHEALNCCWKVHDSPIPRL